MRTLLFYVYAREASVLYWLCVVRACPFGHNNSKVHFAKKSETPSQRPNNKERRREGVCVCLLRDGKRSKEFTETSVAMLRRSLRFARLAFYISCVALCTDIKFASGKIYIHLCGLRFIRSYSLIYRHSEEGARFILDSISVNSNNKRYSASRIS